MAGQRQCRHDGVNAEHIGPMAQAKDSPFPSKLPFAFFGAMKRESHGLTCDLNAELFQNAKGISKHGKSSHRSWTNESGRSCAGQGETGLRIAYQLGEHDVIQRDLITVCALQHQFQRISDILRNVELPDLRHFTIRDQELFLHHLIRMIL